MPEFDELIHAPTRLAIVSLLAAADWAEFKYVRDAVDLSDSALSKQLTTLEGICLIPCTETDDLKTAIATYKKLAKR